MTQHTLPYTRTPTGLYCFTQSVSTEQLLTLAEQIIEQQFRRDTQITSAIDAARFVKLKLALQPRQVLALLLLDRQARLIAFEPVCWGSIDSTKVYPRELIKTALQHNAASVILVQNQPSGMAKPGRYDAEVSAALQKVLAYLDITLLDHLIVGAKTVVSLSAQGVFNQRFTLDEVTRKGSGA